MLCDAFSGVLKVSVAVYHECLRSCVWAHARAQALKILAS